VLCLDVLQLEYLLLCVLLFYVFLTCIVSNCGLNKLKKIFTTRVASHWPGWVERSSAIGQARSTFECWTEREVRAGQRQLTRADAARSRPTGARPTDFRTERECRDLRETWRGLSCATSSPLSARWIRHNTVKWPPTLNSKIKEKPGSFNPIKSNAGKCNTWNELQMV